MRTFVGLAGGLALALALALALLAVGRWRCSGPTEVPALAADAGDVAGAGSEPAGAVATVRRGPSVATAHEHRLDVTPVAEAIEPCRAQLVGLLSGVPWTAPLEWRFQVIRKHQQLREVDALGVSSMPPPDGAKQLDKLSFRAADPAYRLVGNHIYPSLQAGATKRLRVEPIGLLHGVVQIPSGQTPSMCARIQAFRWRASGSLGAMVASTQAQRDGTFRLRAPAAVDLLIVADVPLPKWRLESGARGDIEFGVPEDLAVSDADTHSVAVTLLHDSKLLPDSVRATCAHTQSRQLPALRLRAAAELTGRLLDADARPVRSTLVFAYPAKRMTRGSSESLHWLEGVGPVRGGRTRTDSEGWFVLTLAPGVPFVISTVDERRKLLPDSPRVTAMAPGHVELAWR